MKSYAKLSKTISLILLTVVLIVFSVPAFAASNSESKYGELDASKWSLVWSDEFTGSSVDMSKWQFTIGGGGFGNNEQQYYTDSTNNAYLENGCLVLNAIQGSYGGENYTSAKLSSKESWKYGRFEFRAKLPAGTGLWPAIWMLPQDMSVYGGEWPICGEIDIMEYMGSDVDTVLGTLHYGNPWVYNTGYYNLAGGSSFAADFHDFAMEWLPGEIRWYVDGQLYQIQQNWYSTDENGTYAYPAPFDQEFYLMLNLAVGGFFPGDPNPADWTSTKFSIDYVRVYEYTGELTPTNPSTQTPGENLLSNSSFDIDHSGWETWSENGAVFTNNSGTLQIDVGTILPNTWSTQFYQNVDVYNTNTYRLSFKAKSSVSRPITVGVEGAGNASLFSQTFTATPEWQSYSFDFSPAATFSNAKLLFFLGNVSGAENTAHTMMFDDITLVPLADSLVKNGGFDSNLDNWATWTENGSTYSVPSGSGCFEANIPTTLPNTWSAQLYQSVDIPAAGTYRIMFRAKSSMTRQICVALEKEGMSPLLTQTADVGAGWSEYQYDFTVTTPASAVKLVFMLGCVGSTANSAHSVNLDDIALLRIA